MQFFLVRLSHDMRIYQIERARGSSRREVGKVWMLGIAIINLITEVIILISIIRISNTIKNIPGKITGKKSTND